MDYKEYKAKTVDDCITAACEDLTVPSTELDYVVIEQGSSGFLGIGSKDAVIKAKVKEIVNEAAAEAKPAEAVKPAAEVSAPVVKKEASANISTNVNCDSSEIEKKAVKFLTDVFASMNLPVNIDAKYDETLCELNIDLSGDEMGVLIGKRGQTLDSVQYLVSLVVNKGTGDYIRVKVDTENYRQRRKDTLENLAKNIASKVKRTRHAVSLEPMNPYERRIIHSALQDDRFVTTHSEGEEPYRHVVVTMKRQ